MAAPNDPLSAGAAGPAGFARARITPDEADRLAAQFRPSWEIDQEPAADAGALSDADIRLLRGGGTLADVRGAMTALNGSHAPSPSTILAEPTVIVDDGANDVLPARLGHAPTQGSPGESGAVARAADASRLSRPGTATVIIPHKRTPPASLDLRNISKRPHFGLWLGLTAAAFTLIVVGVWLVSNPDETRGVRAEAPSAQPMASQAAAKPVEAPSPTVPPAGASPTPTAIIATAPQNAAAAPSAVAAAPVQARAEATAPAPAIVPAPRPTAVAVSPPGPARLPAAPASPPAWVASPAQAPLQRAPMAAQVPRPPTPSPPPTPRASVRSKTAGPTIVHEVPF